MAGGGLLLQPSYTEDLVYPSYQDRLLIKSLGVQAGVVEFEDYKVSAGTGLQVNVKKGKAFVEQTKAIEESENTFYNGLYNILNPIEQNPYNNVEVSAVNNQIAQIVARVYDVGELKTGGSSFARLEWVNGAPNVLATEAKMKEGIYEGAAALPQSSVRLASVLVPKNATKSSEYYIQDRRSWSLGALWLHEYSSESSQSFSSNINTIIKISGDVELMQRIELLSGEANVTFSAGVEGETAGDALNITLRINGSNYETKQIVCSSSLKKTDFFVRIPVTKRIGSNLFELYGSYSGTEGAGHKITIKSPIDFQIQETKWGRSNGSK